METSIITSKGQLLIPKRLRNKYGIKSGVKVIFEETDEGVVLRPMNELYFKSFMGILKGSGNLQEEIRDMKEEEKGLEERKLNLSGKKNIKPK
ncbi:MAG: AbrB/MazE/SpoVT family DNA-binding domain-containing protein [Chitinophagaceae bacterium]